MNAIQDLLFAGLVSLLALEFLTFAYLLLVENGVL